MSGGTKLENYIVQWSESSGKMYYVRVLTVNSEGLMSYFCARANAGGYLCSDDLALLDGNVVTSSFVSARPK